MSIFTQKLTVSPAKSRQKALVPISIMLEERSDEAFGGEAGNPRMSLVFASHPAYSGRRINLKPFLQNRCHREKYFYLYCLKIATKTH
jgi:hypothetical protein